MLKRILLSDAEIIRRVRENDRTVLGQLYVHYGASVKRFVQKHGGGPQEADDVLQEAIIVLWKKIVDQTLEPKAKISTYLYAVAKNIWFNETRRKSRQAKGGIDPDIQPDGDPSPLDRTIYDEKTEAVHRALNALQKICRDLLYLFYFEKRSMNEIARALHFANGNTAKAKKYQCLQKLKEQMSHGNK